MSVARARLLEPLYKIDVPLTHVAAGHRRRHRRHDRRRARSATWATRCTSSSAATSSAGACSRSTAPSRAASPPSSSRRSSSASSTTPTSRSTSRAELAGFHGFIGNFASVIESRRRQAHAGRPRRRRSSPPARRKSGPSSSASAQATRSSPAWTSSSCWPPTTEAVKTAKSVGFILCAGSLDENKPYCSRTCCAQCIKNAIRAQGAGPRPAGLRVVQGDAHLRPARGVLHAGPRAGRDLHALRQRRPAAWSAPTARSRSPTATRT